MAGGYRPSELLDFVVGGLAVVAVLLFFVFSGDLFGGDGEKQSADPPAGQVAPHGR